MERGLELDKHLYIVPYIDDVMIITSLEEQAQEKLSSLLTSMTVRGLLKTLGKFNAQLNL